MSRKFLRPVQYSLLMLFVFVLAQASWSASAQEDGDFVMPTDFQPLPFVMSDEPTNSAPPQMVYTPELEITLTSQAQEVYVGDTVTLELTVNNVGKGDLSDFFISFTLPENVTLSEKTEGFSLNNGRLVQAVNFISGGESQTYLLDVVVGKSASAQEKVAVSVGAPHLPEASITELILDVADGNQSQMMTVSSDLPQDNQAGAWVPNFPQATVSTFSGAATYGYPIQVPPGRNGLQPSVNLSYSSKAVDGIIGWHASDWTGLGWSLAQIDIVRTNIKMNTTTNPSNGVTSLVDFSNSASFQLVLNGASYNLQKLDHTTNYGIYIAEGAPDLYIERINACSDEVCDTTGGSPENYTHEYFIVKTSNGTAYRLGYTHNSEQVIGPMKIAETEPYGGIVPGYTAYRFRVDTITDIHGNKIAYEYLELSSDRHEGDVDPTYDNPGREIASYPRSIKYNETTPGNWLTEIKFTLAEVDNQEPATGLGSTDTWKWRSGWALHDLRLFRTRYKLEDIQVLWDGEVIKTYDIAYQQPERVVTGPGGAGGVVLVLDKITEIGLGGETLPPTEFMYEQMDNKARCYYPNTENCPVNNHLDAFTREGFPYERLTEVHNGYGGSVVFTYGHDDRRDVRGGGFLNYHVATQTVYDGVHGPVSITQYEYVLACYNQWFASWEPGSSSHNCPQPNSKEYGPILGYAEVIVTTKDSNGTPLNKVQHYYHTNPNGEGSTHYPGYNANSELNDIVLQEHYRMLVGREYLTEMYDYDSTIPVDPFKLLQKSINTFHTTFGYLRDDIEGDNCPTHDSTVTFVCLVETASYTHLPYDWANNDPSMFYETSRTTFGYDMEFQVRNYGEPEPYPGANQPLQQFGHVVRQTQYKDGVPYLTTRSWYIPNTTTWLVNNLVQQMTYEGNSWNPLNGSWVYYDNQAPDDIATAGKVTRTRQLAHVPFGTNGCVLMPHCYLTVDAFLAYDDVYTGNVITTTTYTDEGSLLIVGTTYSSSDPAQGQTNTLIGYDQYGILPDSATNALGQTVTTVYGGQVPLGTQENPNTVGVIPWLPSQINNIDGTYVIYEFDPFGRLFATYDTVSDRAIPGMPYDGSALTRYDYFDNTWAANTVWGRFGIMQWTRPGTGLAPNVATLYDGLGRAVQTRTYGHELTINGNETSETAIISTTEYDSLGRAFCQTTPISLLISQSYAYNDFICADDAEKTITTFGDFGQPVATTAPDGSISQSLMGQYAGYSVNPNLQFASQFSNQLGQLKGVDEYKINWQTFFDPDSNLNNWNVTGDVSIHANGHAYLHNDGVQPILNRAIGVGANENATLTIDFMAGQVNGLSWLSMEKGIWNEDSYRLWGLLIDNNQIKLQQWSGDSNPNNETKTVLMTANPGVWYRALLRTSRSSDQEFVLVVWERDNPAVMAEIKIAKSDTEWLTGNWSFTAKTNNADFYLDSYTEAEAYRTTYNYNLLGGLESVVDAAGNTTSSMTYDNFGRKTGMTDADMGSWTYTYNALGSLTKQVANGEDTLCFYYDTLNRLAHKATASSGTTCASSVTSADAHWLASYVYGTTGINTGKLTNSSWRRDTIAKTGIDSESFAYDPNKGYLTSQTRVINGQYFTMGYGGFDALYRPTTISYPDGEIVETEYDMEGENQLTIGTQFGGSAQTIVDSVKYNHLGQMTQFNRSEGGGDTTYSYYGAGGNYRLQAINHAGSIGYDNLPDYTYTYDKVGNITSLNEAVGGLNHYNVTYTYDSLNRLLLANYSDSTIDPTFAYDKLGNMIQKGEAEYIYDTIQPHAVDGINDSNAGYSSFEYDTAGNMTRRETQQEKLSQVFDTENRLVKVVNMSNGYTTLFYYDAAGQRTMSVEPDATTTYYPFPNFEKEVPGNVIYQTSFEQADNTLLEHRWFPGTAIMRSTGGPADTDRGEYSYAISNLALGQLLSDKINVSGNTTYTTSVWVQAQVNAGSSTWKDYDVYVVEYASDNSEIKHTFIADGFAPTTWQQVGSSFTTQPNTAKVAIVLYAQYNDGWVVFDDVYLGNAQTNNLVLNSGFEDSTGWTTYAPSTHPGTGFLRSSAFNGTHSGSYAYGITNLSSGRLDSGYINISQKLTYELKVWARGQVDQTRSIGTDINLTVVYYDASNVQIGNPVPVVNGTVSTTWQQFGGQLTPPANAAKVKIWLYAKYNTGWVTFDDVSLTEVGSTTNLVPDPGFELGTGWTALAPGLPNTMYLRNSGGTAAPRSGSFGYSITNQSWGMIKTPMINVQAGQSYTVNTWVNGEINPALIGSSGMNVVVIYYDANNNQLSYIHAITGNVPTSWQQKSHTFTTPPNTAKIAIQLMNMYNNGWIAYDDLVVTKGGAAAQAITRKTYLAAGQPVAMNIAGNSDPAKNGLFFIYTDHLGSANTTTKNGVVVADDRFLPFGEYKNGTPSNSLFDRGFTGHLHNNDLGLIYMNARYYLPGVGKFASADTIVPNPANPQTYNRYSYVYNNPINLNDPTGHYGDDVHRDLTITIGQQAWEDIASVLNVAPQPWVVVQTNSSVALSYSAINASAYQIAMANIGTDYDPNTEPFRNIFEETITDYGQTVTDEPTDYYHFISRNEAESRLIWAINNNDLDAFGRAMHSYQDTFSHIESGYSFNTGEAGLLELLEECESCMIGTSSRQGIINIGAAISLGHAHGKGTDVYTPSSARDTSMRNGTYYWIIILYLTQQGADIDQFFWDKHNMSRVDWYAANVNDGEAPPLP